MGGAKREAVSYRVHKSSADVVGHPTTAHLQDADQALPVARTGRSCAIGSAR